MDFTLDDTQHAVSDLAASVLRHDPDDNRARAALASEAGFDDTAWKAMAQAGLTALAVPEAAGGDGQGAVEAGLVLAEVGRQTLPLPALATIGLGVLPLAAHAGDPEVARVLAAVVDGAVLTAALRAAPGSAPACSDAAVSGSFVGVPYAAEALALLVPVGAGTALVDPHGAGVTLTRTASSAGAPEYSVRLDGAPALTEVAVSAARLDEFAVTAAAAVGDGVVSGALDLTARHLREREQFGRPLATFQAVAQQVADVYVIARTVHLTAVSCAWRLANDRDVAEDAAVAAYWLASRLPQTLQICHHLHGGLGVDITYPLHRYYSHAKDLARLVGGSAQRLDRLGDRCSSN